MDMTALLPCTLPFPYTAPAFIGLKVCLPQGDLFQAGDLLVIQRQHAPAGAGQWSVVNIDGAMALAQLAPAGAQVQVTLPEGTHLQVRPDELHVEGALVGKFRGLM